MTSYDWDIKKKISDASGVDLDVPLTKSRQAQQTASQTTEALERSWWAARHGDVHPPSQHAGG